MIVRTLTLGGAVLALAACAHMEGGEPAGSAAADRFPGDPITHAQALGAAAAMWDVIDANNDGAIDVQDRDAARDEAFARVDRDRNGELGRAELGAASPEFQRAQRARRDDWFARLDRDRNGGLSRAELAAGGGAALPAERNVTAVQLFRMADADGDSRVTRGEYDAAVERHFAMFDRDHDGRISRAEHEAGRTMLGRTQATR